MRVEERITQELRSAAEAMPERTHDFPHTLQRAKRGLQLRRGMLVAVAAAVAVLGFWGATTLTAEPAGMTLPPAAGDQRIFSDQEVEAAIGSFTDAIAARDLDESWEMLTLRSKQRVGAQDKWAQAASELRNEISWIEDDSGLSITHLPAREPETYLATYTAPPEGGSAYLEVFTLEAPNGELGVDLKRRNEISFLPESPVFRACAVAVQPGSTDESPCPPEEMWPEVRSGDTFSFLLERLENTFTTTIDNVWFTVGDSDWVGEARLTEGSKEVRAQATFQPDNVSPGENVFTITVETSDGELETYGYRVRYVAD